MSIGEQQNKIQKEETFFLWGMVISMFVWGLSWASGKVLTQYASADIVATFRFSFTFISMFFVVLFAKVNFVIHKKAALHLFLAAVSLALYSYLFFQGLSLGQAGAGGVLVTILNPIIAYVIMLLMSKRFPNRKEALGLVLGLVAGVILLKLWLNWEMLFHAGNSFFLLAALTWAILSIFTSKASRYGSPISFSFWLYGLSALISIPFIDHKAAFALFLNADQLFWGNLFFSSTITTAFATTFFFLATNKIGASKASSFIFLVPFSATLGSWIFLGEIPFWNTLIGGIVGILAVYVLNKSKAKAQKHGN